MATPPRKRPLAAPVAPAADEPPTVTKRTPTLAAKPDVTKQVAAKQVVGKLPAGQQPPADDKSVAAAARPKARRSAAKAAAPAAMREAKFSVGAVVRHRVYPFRGIVFDIDPVFNNTEDWWQAIPEEIRPRKDQPFYHLLAENSETTYVAYVSEQNLLADKTGQPVRHPQVKEMFAVDEKGQYRARFLLSH
jgi:heat shock protein HspQ